MKKTLATLFLLTCLGSSSAYADNALILQTDFSLKDGAVSAMKGVAFGVDHNLKIFDLTHEIPPYNIWGRRLPPVSDCQLLAARFGVC